MICESCNKYVHPLVATRVMFDDDTFDVCVDCAALGNEKGGIVETLNRIRYWSTGTLATR